MASTVEAAALTAAAQRAQLQNAALIAELVRQSWSATVRPTSLFETAQRLAELLTPYILRQRGTSALIARQYYQTFRVLETGDRTPIQLTSISTEGLADKIATSLRVTGPIAYQRRLEKISGQDLDPAVEKALLDKAWEQTTEGVVASMTRHVLDGGREQTMDAVEEDDRALAHARVTNGNCCYFCAMLASRGPVYKGDSFDDSDPRFTGPGDAKVHDNCACGFEPVFRLGTAWPGRAKEFEQLWIDVTKDGHRTQEAIKEFRRRLEGRAS